MTSKNGIYQSSLEQRVAEYRANLFQGGELFTGFRSPAKAADVTLCQLDELNMGHLTHVELAHEIDLLNDFLREEEGLYTRDTRFYNLLSSAAMRIRWLAAETFGSSTVESPMAERFNQIVDGTEDTLNNTYTHNVKVFREGDVRNRKRDGQTPRPDLPPPPIPKLSHSEPHKDTWTVADLEGDDGPVLFIPGDNPTVEHTHTDPKRFERNGLIGVTGGKIIGVLTSASFGHTFGETRRALMAKGTVFGRILTLINRVAGRMEVYDSSSMEDLAIKILRKHPEVSPLLVTACLEVGNPFWQYMSQQQLDEVLGKLRELVKIVDYREGEFANEQ